MEPIVTLTLSLDDARELYKTLMARAIVEETLRREQGLESVDPPALMGRLEQVLQIQPEQVARLGEHIEDELWQHAWLTFTDEWAWHRAKQDVQKELGKKNAERLTPPELERAVEARYNKTFEKYLLEVELPGHEEGASCIRSKTERIAAPHKPKSSRA
ncbi:hypothetical protein KBB27_02105 [Patescibacteria group bacterium]|nr:hypothetical protein [Patescibacteria group bacterium]